LQVIRRLGEPGVIGSPRPAPTQNGMVTSGYAEIVRLDHARFPGQGRKWTV